MGMGHKLHFLGGVLGWAWLGLTSACIPSVTAKQTHLQLEQLAQSKVYHLDLQPIGVQLEIASIAQPTWSYKQHVGHLQALLTENHEMQCFYYLQDIPLAQLLHTFVETVVTSVEKHELTAFEASQVRGHPYLFATSRYQHKQQGSHEMYYLVARAASVTSVCLMEGEHEADLFLQANLAILKNQKQVSEQVSDQQAPLRWRGVYKSSKTNGLVGVVEKRMYYMDKESVVLSFEHYIGKNEAKQLVVLDRYVEQFSDGEGKLLQGRILENIGDELSSDMHLEKQVDSGYQLKGIRSGKPVEQILLPLGIVLNWPEQYKACVQSDASVVVLPHHWTIFDVDSSSLLEQVHVHCLLNGKAHLEYETSHQMLDVHVDAEGFPLEQSSKDSNMIRQWNESFLPN